MNNREKQAQLQKIQAERAARQQQVEIAKAQAGKRRLIIISSIVAGSVAIIFAIVLVFSMLGGGIEATIDGDLQRVSGNVGASSYPVITVKKGIPVEFTLNVSQSNLNSCNNEVVMSSFGVRKQLTVGTNVIKFTPTQTGSFSYTCWMGMIKSKVNVVS